jgi:DNA-binding NarL/FixJ family response regulator
MKKFKSLLVGNFENNWSLLSLFVESTELAGAVTSGEEAINTYSLLRAEIIFVDAFLPGMSGFEMARFVKEQNPAVKVVIVSEKFNLDFLYIAMELKLEGYISKNMDDQLLTHALKNLKSGKSCFDTAIVQMLEKEGYKKQEN